jgi:hypothetical protein
MAKITFLKSQTRFSEDLPMERLGLHARFVFCACIVSTLIVFAQEPAPPNLFARASDVDVVAQGETGLATFKLHVTNHEDAALENVSVVFADGSSVPIGNVEGQATVVSELQNRVIEILVPGSQSIPVHVTFTLFFEGSPFEVAWPLNLGTE